MKCQQSALEPVCGAKKKSEHKNMLNTQKAETLFQIDYNILMFLLCIYLLIIGQNILGEPSRFKNT